MQLQKAVQHVFSQLTETLDNLSDEQYILPSKTLSGATIGQHTRHIIEMFICLEDGYKNGTVNYELRKRDKRIETDRSFAIELLQSVQNGLSKPCRDIVLEGSYHEDITATVKISTNYHREIAYNLEHTIHHMALVKIGIRELSDINLPEGFGIASSTLKHQKECAQ